MARDLVTSKRSGLLDAQAGCDVCHGLYVAAWTGRNAVGVAARHAMATGHPVWAEQTTSVTWNRT